MIAEAAVHKQRREAGHAADAWDMWLMTSVLALLGLGAVMVYSASVSGAERATGNGAYYLVRHVGHIVLGLLAMALVMRTRLRHWERAGPYLLLTGIALLAMVLLPGIGVHINGSTRWIRLGTINLQPSELVKVFVVVYVAGYLVRKQAVLPNFVPGILMIGLVIGVIGLLLLRQPDLGTMVVICLTILGMLFLGGVRLGHFLVIVAAGVAGTAMLTLASPYRFERVTGFLNPWADPFNSGFQLVQALIAFGRGEWFGVGLGASVQKLFYLPAAHTDFILAVLAEELGLVGVLLVIALFAVLILRSFVIARRAEQAGHVFAARLAQGIGLLFAVQSLINMGVNMGMLPTKGLTLPFMSYGGSSMLASCIAVGLLLMVEREVRLHSWDRR